MMSYGGRSHSGIDPAEDHRKPSGDDIWRIDCVTLTASTRRKPEIPLSEWNRIQKPFRHVRSGCLFARRGVLVVAVRGLVNPCPPVIRRSHSPPCAQSPSVRHGGRRRGRGWLWYALWRMGGPQEPPD